MQHRMRDLAIETGIGLVVVAVVCLSALYIQPGHGIDVRWFGLLGTTYVTFAYPIRTYCHYWRKHFFWIAIGGLLIVHLSAYVIVLLRVERWGLSWFVVITVLEWQAIFPILGWACKKS